MSWDANEQRWVQGPLPGGGGGRPPLGGPPEGNSSRRVLIVAAVVVLLCAAAGAGLWALVRDHGSGGSTPAGPLFPSFTVNPSGDSTDIPELDPTPDIPDLDPTADIPEPDPTTAPAPPPPPNYYGAIAVGSDGSIGKSWDYNSLSAADQGALSKCSGSDCKVLVDFVNSCGAVAYNSSTNRYWGGQGATATEAENDAISRAGGGRWITYVCTTRYG